MARRPWPKAQQKDGGLRMISLKAAVAVLLGMLATSAIGFVALKADSELTRNGLEHQRELLTTKAAQMRYRLDRAMFERFRDIGNAASIETLRTGTLEERRALLDRLRDSYRDYGWIGFADARGTVVAATDGLLEGQDVSSRPWYRGARARSAPFVGDVHQAQLLGTLLPAGPDGGPIHFVDFAAPVRDANNRFVGVLGAHLRWTWADEVRRSLMSEFNDLEKIEIFILRSDGTVLLGDNAAMGARLPCPLADPGRPNDIQYGEMACEGGNVYMAAQVSTQGYRTYPGLGWIVLIRQDLDAALAPVVAARQDLLGWGLVMAVIFVGIGWMIADWSTQPLRRLALAADAIRQGDRDAPMPRDGRLREFGLLTQALRSMIGELTSAQRRVEATAAQAERERQRLDTIITSLTDSLCAVQDGHVVFGNAAFRRLLALGDGPLPADLLLVDLLHDEDRDQMADALRMARQAPGKGLRLNVRLMRPGAVRHMEVSLSAFDGPEGPAVLAILHDVTEQTQMAAQLAHAQRIEALGNLAGGISHDFNNLLTVIVGNLDLLEEALEDRPAARTHAGRALEAALRGSDLTRQLLTFSRKRPLVARPLEINALICGTVDMLRRTLGEHVAVEVDLQPDLWQVATDKAQMENAITNLAINARDAMPDGGRLTLRTRNRPATGADGDMVVMEVADTGSGIDPEVLPRIFEPFFTTKEEGKGTGLGLPMIHGFVYQSGGRIEVDSAPGSGTRFALMFPRAEGDLPNGNGAQAALPPLRQGLSVLLVEDRDEVRAVVADHLRALGCRVTEVADGPAALERMGPGIDVLFTDIRLPGGLLGSELAVRMRAARPDLPVIFASGYAGLSPAELAQIGAIGPMIDKPFRQRDVELALRRVLAPQPVPQGQG